MMQDYNPTLAPPTGADLNNPLTPQQLAARLGVSLFTLKLWRLTNKGPKWFNLNAPMDDGAPLVENKGAVRYRLGAVIEWEMECERRTQQKVGRQQRKKEGLMGGEVEVEGGAVVVAEVARTEEGV